MEDFVGKRKIHKKSIYVVFMIWMIVYQNGKEDVKIVESSSIMDPSIES